jgi:hypothetical protein
MVMGRSSFWRTPTNGGGRRFGNFRMAISFGSGHNLPNLDTILLAINGRKKLLLFWIIYEH